MDPCNHARVFGAPAGRAVDTRRLSALLGGRGTWRGKVSAWRAGRRGHPSVAGAGAADRAEPVAESSAAAPGLSSGRLYLWAPVPASRRFPCGEATPGAPGPGRPLPAEVTTNGERGPGAVRLCTRERGAPPPPVGLRIAVAQSGALPRRATSDSRARSKAARRLAFSSVDGRWGTKHPDRLANDRRAVERGRGGAENAGFESWN